jgi:hypothetical protein
MKDASGSGVSHWRQTTLERAGLKKIFFHKRTTPSGAFTPRHWQ